MATSYYEKMTKLVKKNIHSGKIKEADDLLDAWLLSGFRITDDVEHGGDPICISLLKMGVNGQDVLWRCFDRNNIKYSSEVKDQIGTAGTLLHIAAWQPESVALPFLTEWHRRGLPVSSDIEFNSPIGIVLTSSHYNQKGSFKVIKKLLDMGCDPWEMHQNRKCKYDEEGSIGPNYAIGKAPAWMHIMAHVNSPRRVEDFGKVVNLFREKVSSLSLDFPEIRSGQNTRLSFAGLISYELNKIDTRPYTQDRYWKIVDILPQRYQQDIFYETAELMLKSFRATEIGISMFVKQIKNGKNLGDFIGDELVDIWNDSRFNCRDIAVGFYEASLKHIASLGGFDSNNPRLTQRTRHNFETKICYIYDKVMLLADKVISKDFDLESSMASGSKNQKMSFSQSEKSIKLLLDKWLEKRKECGNLRNFDLKFLGESSGQSVYNIFKERPIVDMLISADVIDVDALIDRLSVFLESEKDSVHVGLGTYDTVMQYKVSLERLSLTKKLDVSQAINVNSNMSSVL